MIRLTLATLLTLSGASAHAGEELVEEGRKAYKQFCSHCHGLEMVNPGTSSFDLRKWPRDQRDDFVVVVSAGRGDMPAWGDVLYPEEIDALWAYVATRGGTEPLPEEEDG